MRGDVDQWRSINEALMDGMVGEVQSLINDWEGDDLRDREICDVTQDDASSLLLLWFSAMNRRPHPQHPTCKIPVVNVEE